MEAAITPVEQIDKEIYYNCSECSSLIEIKELSEKNDTIKFICINKGEEKKISIKEYLEKMKKFKNNIKDKCEKHDNEQYRYYCMDCKCNLCDKCTETKIHKRHKKEIINDWKPDDEELKIIEDRINNYDNKMKILKDEKEKRINELKKILKNEIFKKNKKYKKKKKYKKLLTNK